jgi:osmotically inducible lipoprotein OsmB
MADALDWSQIMNRIVLVTALLFSSALGGCGSSTGDRAASGAAIGAGGGALAGWALGSPALGALAGGAAGAAVGGLTSPDQINLGKPVWR